MALTDTTITGANTVRKFTRRETIDEMLWKASNLARENVQSAFRLRRILVGSLPEEQVPEQPARPGWLGEIADTLEPMIEYLEDTARMLDEVSQQVTPQMPLSAAPRR